MLRDQQRTIGAKHPYEANRVLELISKMFSLARGWVTHEELPRLMQAIGQDPNYYARAALWLYLLTGMRKSELLKACWDDINCKRPVTAPILY